MLPGGVPGCHEGWISLVASVDGSGFCSLSFFSSCAGAFRVERLARTQRCKADAGELVGDRASGLGVMGAPGLDRWSVRLKVDFGPGYRVYSTERAGVLIVLLAGGDKSSQQQDIKTAISLAKGL